MTREFDVTTKAFVEDGFVLPEAKSRVGWRDIDSLFVATDFGPGSLTKSGYPRIVKEWRRGTPLTDAAPVFEGQPDDVSVSAVRSKTPGYERDWVSRAVTLLDQRAVPAPRREALKIEKPDDAAGVCRSRSALHRTPHGVGSRGQDVSRRGPAGVRPRGLPQRRAKIRHAVRADRAQVAGRFFAEPAATSLLNELDNVRNRLYVLTREAGKWRREELPGAPQLQQVSASPIDPDESDDYFMTVTDYLTPTSLYFGTLGKGPAERLKEGPSFFDAEGLAVTQHEAVSKDGTRIPYFQVARRDLSLNGRNPTLLYGYGGFEISMTPGYQPVTGAAWLEARRRVRRRQHPRRRRVRAQVASGGARSRIATRPTTISSPWPRT